jgi:hypothetical protein
VTSRSRPGDIIVGNPGTPEEFRQEYQPDPETFRQEVLGEFQENSDNVFRAEDVRAAIGHARGRVALPASSVLSIMTDASVPRGQVYVMTEGRHAGTIMAHPDEAASIREQVEGMTRDPGHLMATPLTSRPLTGFRSTPIARGQQAQVSEGTVVDRQGNRHTVGPFEVDLPDTPGPHRVGLDIARGGDVTVATILVDGKVTGQVPIKRSTFKTEKLPPKSSWERLMEDDDDECQ